MTKTKKYIKKEKKSFNGTIESGQLSINKRDKFDDYIDELKNCKVEIIIKKLCGIIK